MVSKITRKMVLAASNSVMQSYIDSNEYIGYCDLKKGNIDTVIDMIKSASTSLEQSFIDDEIKRMQVEFPQMREEQEKTERLIREQGFEEYFLDQNIRERVMTEVVRYLLDNPEISNLEPEQNQFRYAFDHAIHKVLTQEEYDTLITISRMHKRTDET